MDSNWHQARTGLPSLMLRPRTLGRPEFFDAPQLTEPRPASAPDDYAQQVAAAISKGRVEGLRLARAEVDAALAAHDAATRELRRVTGALAEAVRQLTAKDQEDLSEIQGQAVLFGLELAEQVIGRELETCGDELRITISRAMNLVPDRGMIDLRVNPADTDAARAMIDGTTGLTGRIELIADPQIQPGSCATVVGPLRIDADMGQVIERVRHAVRS